MKDEQYEAPVLRVLGSVSALTQQCADPVGKPSTRPDGNCGSIGNEGGGGLS